MRRPTVNDGTELRTTDARLPRDIWEGEEVRVDFIHEGNRNLINSIEPVQPDTVMGAAPTAVGSGITSH